MNTQILDKKLDEVLEHKKLDLHSPTAGLQVITAFAISSSKKEVTEDGS